MKDLMATAQTKAATGHVGQSLCEKDELLKSLGSQLNVDFSTYSQWQRKKRVVRPVASVKKVQEASMMFKVGTIHGTRSSPCAPKSTQRDHRTRAKLEYERRKQQEKYDMLELKIKHSKETTDMYSKRAKELIEINIDMAKEIESQEHEVHAEVKRLLRKYEKFRGGIAAMNSHFAKEISEVKHELEATKESIRRKLEVLEQQVQEKDEELRSKQDELHILQDYKDKEYPVKALTIAGLQAELEHIQNTNQEDQEDLEYVISTELGKYDKERIRLANGITQRATEESIALMHPSLTDMALQNIMMKKEIDFHVKEQEVLLQSNKELEKEVAVLLKHSKSSLRLQIFPELFPQKEKCTPDIELVLDIPRQEWLPM